VPDNAKHLYASLQSARPGPVGGAIRRHRPGRPHYAETFCNGGRRFDADPRRAGCTAHAADHAARCERRNDAEELAVAWAADWIQQWPQGRQSWRRKPRRGGIARRGRRSVLQTTPSARPRSAFPATTTLRTICSSATSSRGAPARSPSSRREAGKIDAVDEHEHQRALPCPRPD